MRSIVTAGLVWLSLIGAGGLVWAEDVQTRIIGGVAAPSGEYDFFGSIMFKSYWENNDGTNYHWNPFCGASYIGGGIVMTAAHCVDDVAGTNVDLGVVLGDQSRNFSYEYCSDDEGSNYDCVTQDRAEICLSGYTPTDLLVYEGSESNIFKVSGADIKIHDSYVAGDYDFDIALIDLGIIAPGNEPIEIALSSGSYDDFSTVIGHGDINNSSSEFTPSTQLVEVGLPVVSDSECIRVYGENYESDTMLCAGFNLGSDGGVPKDSCQGDSGGPLFVDDNGVYVQRGIVSFGQGCAITYGVYSDVAMLKEWIDATSEQISTSRTWDGGFERETTRLNKRTQMSEFTPRDLCSPSSSNRFIGGGSFSPLWLVLMAPLALCRRTRKGPLALVLLSTLGLAACGSNPFQSEPPEVVFNPAITNEGLEFSVMSNGCTAENHLLLRVKGDDVEVVRLRPDMCRAAPQLKRFVMPLPEQESVWQLVNPVRYSNRVSRELTN